jgi:mannose-6-phosphate isomerase-like protein (cupin superfamily)
MNIINYNSLPTGRFEGATAGPASVSIILDSSEPGGGPRLHSHPYDETWVVERGDVLFRVGDRVERAGAGDIVVAPPNVPHKFTVQGTEPTRMVCIHASATIATEWFE